MKLFGVKGLALAALVISMAALIGGGASVAEDKTEEKKAAKKEAGKKESPKLVTIKHVMAAQNQLGKAVPLAIKAGEWDLVTKQATDWLHASEVLAGNEPPKGTKESWKELTEKYTAETKKLLAAAEKKDAEAATASTTALSKTCGACHGAHKPAKKK